jgi:hypothetical protein
MNVTGRSGGGALPGVIPAGRGAVGVDAGRGDELIATGVSSSHPRQPLS